ncbi:unnamed protein product, partial [Symbiodinium microadriaticum]
VSCYDCLPGLRAVDAGYCWDCAGGDYALLLFFLLIAVSAIVGLYYFLMREGERNTQPGHLLVIALGLSQLVTVIQKLTVIQKFRISWREPVVSILNLFELMSLNLDMLSISCFTSMGPVFKYALRSLIAPIFVCVVVVLHGVNLLLKGNLRKGDLEISQLLRTIGSLFLIFYISVFTAILAPFQCNYHPNGRSTVQEYHTVFCDGQDEHLHMSIIGGVATLMPISFLVICTWVTLVELPRRLQEADVRFVRACSFLYIRFRPGAEIFSVLYLTRNALIVLCPLIPSVSTKLVCMNILLPWGTRLRERPTGSGDLPTYGVREGISPDVPDLQQPITRGQAVNLWRYLLFDRWTFAVPNDRGVVPSSWLPPDTLRDIQVHLGAMSEHNLMIMTVGLVTMVRYLMAELSQSLDVSHAIWRTANQVDDDDVVDIDEEEGDDSALMQSFFQSDGRDTPSRRWSRALIRLHKELEGQPKSIRKGNVAKLREALPAGVVGGAGEWRSRLQALLVAVASDCLEAQCEMAGSGEWLQGWVMELASFIPGYGAHGPQQIDTQPTLAELLEDEMEQREHMAAQHMQVEDEERYRAAHEALVEDEVRHLAEEAQEFQQWEREVTARTLRRPCGDSEGVAGDCKRRCILTVELASGSGDRPAMVQTLGCDVPSDGSSVSLTIRARMEEVPHVQHESRQQVAPLMEPAASEVSTVPFEPAVPHDKPAEPGTADMDTVAATRGSPPDALGLLDFQEYSLLFDQWRQGRLSQQDIEQQFGLEVMELILAQEAVQDAEAEDSPVDLPVAPTLDQFTPMSGLVAGEGEGRPTRRSFAFFEAVYGDWKADMSSDHVILDKYGLTWLSLFQQWRLWGLEAVWALLPKILDMSPDLGMADDRVHQPPEPLELPLRVPFSAVRARHWLWVNGVLPSDDLRRRYGPMWVRLFQRLHAEGLEAVRLGLTPLVEWDVVELGENPDEAGQHDETRDEAQGNEGKGVSGQWDSEGHRGLYASLTITSYCKPWRVMAGNMLDTLLQICIIVVLDMASVFVGAEVDADTSIAICVFFLVLMFLAILAAVLYGAVMHMRLKQQKPFRFFLCHQKLAAGGVARLLKMRLQRRSGRNTTFVDSDDLNDLTRLFSYVGQDTETFVVLCSPDVLLRKWCIGEICTARAHDVHTVLVKWPEYTDPDEFFISNMESIIPGVRDLANYNISMGDVRESLRFLQTADSMVLPASLCQ